MKLIMKFFVTMAIPVLFSVNAFSLTDEQEAEFKAKIADYSVQKKIGMGFMNLGSIAITCGGGMGLGALSLLSDSLPYTTGKLDSIIDNNTEGVVSVDTKTARYWGGVVAFGMDVLSMIIDYADGEIDDGEYTEAWQHMKQTYDSTTVYYEQTFGESGYCTDQIEQFGILTKLK